MIHKDKQEIFRMLSQVVYWGLLGGVCILAIDYELIKPSTHVDGAVSCFIEERMNGWVIGIDLFIQFVIAGMSALFLRGRYIDFVREEISRSFYALGAFSGCLVVVLHVYFAKYVPARSGSLPADVAMAFLLFAFPVGLGFGLYWLNRPAKEESPASHQSNKASGDAA